MEPARPGVRTVNRQESAFWRFGGVWLAVFWLLLPAVQYLGAEVRTEAVLDRATPTSGLARLDLTPWYVMLLGVTLAFAAARAYLVVSRARPKREQP